MLNWQQYINNYPDLQKAGIDNQVKAVTHWNKYGKREGRTDQPLVPAVPIERATPTVLNSRIAPLPVVPVFEEHVVIQPIILDQVNPVEGYLPPEKWEVASDGSLERVVPPTPEPTPEPEPDVELFNLQQSIII